VLIDPGIPGTFSFWDWRISPILMNPSGFFEIGEVSQNLDDEKKSEGFLRICQIESV